MFLAVWWRPKIPRSDPIAGEVYAALSEPGSVRVEAASASIAAWHPAWLRRHERGGVAYAARGSAGKAPQAHPAVELEGETLAAIAGPLLFYPLYYHRHAGDEYLIICSRLEPLTRILPRAPLCAERLLYDMRASEGAVTPDQGATFYSGIRRLRPCEAIVASAAGIRLDRQVPRLGSAYIRSNDRDLAFELRRQVGGVVGRAIDPAKRVAVFVSGGLDSSGVLAVAARSREAKARELIPISAQFATPGDDRPHFQELMSSLGLTPVRISAGDAGKWFPRSLCVDAQPTGSPACVGLALLEAAYARHADVSLCAGMGDRLLGGTLPFAQLALRGHPLAAAAGALRLRLPWKTTAFGRLRSLVISPLIPFTMLRGRRRRRAGAPWLTARSLALLDRAFEAAERSAGPLPDTPDSWMRALCDDPGQCGAADNVGQMFSLTGCAHDDVFMDLEFVQFMLRIDPVQLSYGNEHRGLYRAAMKGVLPEGVRTRQDKGYVEPVIAAAVLAADALEMVRDLASLRELASRGLVDPGPLGPIFDVWLKGMRRGERTDRDPADEYRDQLWQLLSIEAFLRAYGRGRDLSWSTQ